MSKAKSTTKKKKPTPKKSAIKKAALKKKPAVKKAAPKKSAPKKKPAPKKSAPKKKPAKSSSSEILGPKDAISICEIEIIRRDTDKFLGGRRIQKVEVLNTKALARGQTQATLKQALVGNEINAVTRLGMSLAIEFAKSVGWLLITLGDGGQLRKHRSNDAKDEACALILSFMKGGQLRVNSHMKGTQIKFIKPEDQASTILNAKGIGLDPLDNVIPKELFIGLIRRQPLEKTIKEILTDSNFIVGLGDIYSDEILYKCGLKYDRTISSIPDIKLILLLRTLGETQYEAMKYRGTTLPGRFFCDLEGRPGVFQDYLQVYGRDKELTSSLHEIEKKKFKKRWAYYCPAIQQ